MQWFSSLFILPLIVSAVSASKVEPESKLYISYKEQYPTKDLVSFINDFVSSLHKSNKSIDELLGSENVPHLDKIRDKFAKHCPDFDPKRSKWLQTKIDEIIKDKKYATDDMLAKIYEIFNILPCPNKLGYVMDDYWQVLEKKFGYIHMVDLSHGTYYEVIRLYKEKLAGAVIGLGCHKWSVSEEAKVVLVMDAFDHDYIDKDMDTKKAHLKERIQADDSEGPLKNLKASMANPNKSLLDSISESLYYMFF